MWNSPDFLYGQRVSASAFWILQPHTATRRTASGSWLVDSWFKRKSPDPPVWRMSRSGYETEAGELHPRFLLES